MKFSIVTPSYRGMPWLPLCAASVADQGVECEHIIQDACSDDETAAWLADIPQSARIRAYVERDSGMYDAINRGFTRARGEILGYLNCDEQYLPGALISVAQFFQNNPSVGVLFAHAVVVDGSGAYLCHRKALLPSRAHTLVSGNLSILSCATFIQRRVLTTESLTFDASLRTVGDVAWILNLLQQRVNISVFDSFTSVFTSTGTNLSLAPTAVQERKTLLLQAPLWYRWSRPAIVLHHRLRKLFSGGYSSPSLNYDLFTLKSPVKRVSFQVPYTTGRWQTPTQPR
jgi:glycosyltransferase involved in cell wall biosynthesis